MQSIGGIINDLIILGLFVYVILLINGKVKLTGEKQEKFNNLISKKGLLIKFCVYAAAAIMVILIILTLLRPD
jgi:hypothetical protein